ncbi:MAG: DUF4258 domain-containing protein [Nitrospiraceae bacterium]
MDIEQIRRKVLDRRYVISFTHTEKLRRRTIEIETLEQAIASGEIIESYEDDPRGPSCLILGYGSNRRPLHIVCGNLDEDYILIITAYEPDGEEWEADWRSRKRGKS